MGLLRVEGVEKAFGGFLALAGVHLEVAPGERRAIIGPNGAGKTTLFRIIAGELRPSRGRVLFRGREVTRLPQEGIARLGVARTFQRSSVFPELAVWENVSLARIAAQGQGGWINGPLSRSPEVDGVLDRVGLLDRARDRAAVLSHGERRQLEIAMALVQRPTLLLLDEPLAGLSGAERARIGRLVKDLDSSLAIILVEHDLDYALDFAHRVTVLHYGQVVAEGSPEAIKEDPKVQEIYIGQPGSWRAPEGGSVAPPDPEEVLSVRGLVAGYGPVQVLSGVDLVVRRGEVVAVLGRNGMGKTTLLSALMGWLPAVQGEIRLGSVSVASLPAHLRADLGMALVPQGRRMFEGLSVEEELALAALPRPGRWTVARIYEVFPRLYERRKNLSRSLSGGEQQMLAIARALLRNPRLTLMDEPSEGLAPLVVQQIAGLIRTLKEEGETVLLAEQNVQLALSVADRVYILERGETVWEGTPAEASKDVLRRYLGVD